MTTPMKENAILQAKTKGQAFIIKREKYQEMISSIMFLMVEIRPDVIFTTSVASRFAKNLGHQHIEAVKTILQYLKRSKNQGVMYSS